MTTVLIAALAVWQIIEVWHHSLLFASARARVELWKGKLGELAGCPFCMTPWVAWLVLGVLLLPTCSMEELDTILKKFASGPWVWMPILGWTVHQVMIGLIYGLAVARLANLGNDLTRAWCRTPKSTPEFHDSKNTFENERNP